MSPARRATDGLREGGCALALRNTVAEPKPATGHSRQCSAPTWCSSTPGSPPRQSRSLGGQPPASAPSALWWPAHQVAEQSFDVDVDLLAIDLPPIDLVLQRAGRRTATPVRPAPALRRCASRRSSSPVCGSARWGVPASVRFLPAAR